MSYEACKECGEENPSNSLYCQNCGRRLIDIKFYERIRIMANKEIAENKLIEDKQEKITDISQFEIKIEFSDDPNLIKEYNEKRFYPVLKEIIMLNYNFSDEVKKGIIQDLIDGMEKQLDPYYRARNISNRLDGNMELAQKIELEETMRGSNMSSWIQSKGEGCLYFFIDFCDNESCINKYKYKYFDIDDVEDMPPIYSNCGCVPYYYYDLEEVEFDSKEISNKNLLEYAEETKKHEEPYATGYIAFDLAEEKIKNLNENKAEKELYLDVIPLLERAFVDNITDYTKARVYRAIGDIYYKNGDNELTLKNYEKALSYNPKVGVKRLYDKLKKI